MALPGRGALYKKLFGGKEEEKEKYKIPTDPEKMEELVDEAVQKKLGDLQATVDKLEEENEELRERLKKEVSEEEKEAMERAWKIEQLIEKQKKQNTEQIIWYRDVEDAPLLTSIPDNRQRFRSEDGKGDILSYLRGISIEGGIDNNTPKARFIVSDKKGEKYGKLGRGIFLHELGEVFHENIITHLKRGECPVHLRQSDGMFMKRLMEASQGGAKSQAGQPVRQANGGKPKKCDLSQITKDKEEFYDDADQMMKLMRENRELRKDKKGLEMEKVKSDMDFMAERKKSKKALKNLKDAQDQYERVTSEMPAMFNELQEAKLSAAATESLNQSFWMLLKDLLGKVEELEEPKEEALGEIKDTADSLQRMLPSGAGGGEITAEDVKSATKEAMLESMGGEG